MDTWLSLIGNLVWRGPLRDPLGLNRPQDRRSELRLRVALERELWCEDIEAA
jgi:hypothetical protein